MVDAASIALSIRIPRIRESSYIENLISLKSKKHSKLIVTLHEFAFSYFAVNRLYTPELLIMFGFKILIIIIF